MTVTLIVNSRVDSKGLKKVPVSMATKGLKVLYYQLDAKMTPIKVIRLISRVRGFRFGTAYSKRSSYTAREITIELWWSQWESVGI